MKLDLHILFNQVHIDKWTNQTTQKKKGIMDALNLRRYNRPMKHSWYIGHKIEEEDRNKIKIQPKKWLGE